MPQILIKDVKIVSDLTIKDGHVLVKDGFIEDIFLKDASLPDNIDTVIEGHGHYLLPGIIDTHVHFRDPGLTHKGDMETESMAAVAGGVTSIFEMPNTIPKTVNDKTLSDKIDIAKTKCLTNFAFFLGATDHNLQDLLSMDYTKTCGIKIFMGSSTGDMAVKNLEIIEAIFEKVKTRIAVHCEDDQIIAKNLAMAQEKYGNAIPFKAHPEIRSTTACLSSSKYAVQLAKKYGTKLNIKHISTTEEMRLFDKSPIKDKQIVSEVCVHHLWFDSDSYERLGGHLKCNPAIKEKEQKEALQRYLFEDVVDIIATDHAPHTLQEKQNDYLHCPSGLPLVQYSLLVMIEFYKRGQISLEKIVEKMCHNPAIWYGINRRGFVQKGYHADLCLIDLESKTFVNEKNMLSKCKWSPFKGHTFSSEVLATFVSGNLVYHKGKVNAEIKGQALLFGD